MLQKLQYESWTFDFKFTADLCCINKLCGLGNHKSLFPCYICLWQSKDRFEKGAKLRTLKSLKGKKFLLSMPGFKNLFKDLLFTGKIIKLEDQS